MQAYLVSDFPAGAEELRQCVLRAGFDCPANTVLTTDLVAARLPRDASLVVVHLSVNPERGLETLGQIRSLVPCPVLAVGPATDSKLVLRAMRTGVADFIDERDAANELQSAIHRLRAGPLVHLPEPARTIAIMGTNGGCGASTIAVNVSTSLALKHKSALLMDLNLRSGDLATLLDLRPTHTLAELCQVGSHLDRTMLETSVVSHESGLKLLGPPRWFSEAPHVTTEGVQRVLSIAQHTYPYVVMDLERSFGPEQVAALRMADIIVLVLRLDFTCIRQGRRSLDYLIELGIARERVQLVVNRYGQYREVPAKKAEEALGASIAHYIPEDPKTMNRANNHGIPVVQEYPSARVAKSLMNLAVSVNGRKHS